MNALVRILPAVFAAAAAAIPVTAMAARAEAPPAAARFYPLLGDWKGQGELKQGGGAPMPLALGFSCGKASSGWAVSCRMVAKNGDMTMTESDLMGVDAATGKGHWYAVTSDGETHDHLAEWTDASHMQADYSWTQDGKKMHEHITMALPSEKAMNFRSVVTADGKEVGVFSGDLTR